MKFHRHKLLLLLIVVLGALFRFYNLDKNGLWFDEIGTLSVAKESFPLGIIDTLYHKDIHCPLFYFLLHFWIKLFGDYEFILRFFSAIFGTANIFIFYLIGKTIKSRGTGLITAFLAAISPLLIYFSQEIRFYPLILLLMSLSLLFLIRFERKPSIKNLLGLGVVNLGILYTYTIGLVFVFFQAVIYLGYMLIKLYKDKKPENRVNIKNFVLTNVFCGLLFTPYLPMFFHHLAVSSNSFLNFFDWGRFTLFDIFVAVQNWFSPFTFVYKHDYTETYASFMEIFGTYGFLILFLFIVAIPAIIFISAIVKAVFRKKIMLVLFLIFAAFFSFEILTAMNGRFILHSKYTVLNLPIIIILSGYGLSEIKYRKPILIYLTILFILYLLIVPFSTPHISRTQVYSEVRSILNSYNLTEKDIVVINHGTRYVKDYFSGQTSIVFPLDLEYTYFYRDLNSLEKIFAKSFIKSVSKQNAREKFKSFLIMEKPPKKFRNYIENDLIAKLPDGAKLAIYINRMTAKYDRQELKKITSSPENYQVKSLARMLISKSSNDILTISKENLTLVDSQKHPHWEVYLFRKNSD